MTAVPTPVRKKLPHGFIAIVLLAVFAVVGQLFILFAVGAIGFPDSADTSRITVEDENVAFVVTAPIGTGITTITVGPDSEGCETVVFDFNAHGLIVEAVNEQCEPPEHQKIMNGHHGTYRTLDDVPEPKDAEKVKTYLGPAKVFTQKYVEHTNFTSDYEEPVAIVTLDKPVDPEYPTLVVRSEKGELDRDEFTELVKGLIEPP